MGLQITQNIYWLHRLARPPFLATTYLGSGQQISHRAGQARFSAYASSSSSQMSRLTFTKSVSNICQIDSAKAQSAQFARPNRDSHGCNRLCLYVASVHFGYRANWLVGPDLTSLCPATPSQLISYLYLILACNG